MLYILRPIVSVPLTLNKVVSMKHYAICSTTERNKDNRGKASSHFSAASFTYILLIILLLTEAL